MIFNCRQEWILIVAYQNGLNLVVLMGGEPFLYTDLIYKFVKIINNIGIKVRIETNAFWASSEQEALNKLKPLSNSDLNIMYSLDYFHKKFVSLNNIENALKASCKLKISCCLETAYIDYPNFKNSIDTKTNNMISSLKSIIEELGISIHYKGNILYNGRASKKLTKYRTNSNVFKEKCIEVPWWSNGSYDNFDLIILDPDGNISKGCGISFGNIYNNSIEDIIHNWDPSKHPIISVLKSQGPIGLAKKATTFGYVIKEKYADKCHLCQESRQYLLKEYDEILTPLQHYNIK